MNKDEKTQSRSSIGSPSPYAIVVIVSLVLLTITISNESLLAMAEQTLAGHMIVEHLLFFGEGALSVMAAEVLLHFAVIRQTRRAVSDMTVHRSNRKNGSKLGQRMLQYWLLSLRKIFSLNRYGLIWLILASFILTIWHVPEFFDRATLDKNVHIIQHFSFILVGSFGFLAARSLGESFRIASLIAVCGMMGFAGLLLASLDTRIYLAYSIASHNEAGMYMVIASFIILIIVLPSYIIQRTLRYLQVLSSKRNTSEDYYRR